MEISVPKLILVLCPRLAELPTGECWTLVHAGPHQRDPLFGDLAMLWNLGRGAALAIDPKLNDIVLLAKPLGRLTNWVHT